MAQRITASATGCGNIISASINTSHSAQSSTAILEVESTTLKLNMLIDVNMGYVGNSKRVFRGYVKNIEEKESEHVFTITASDVLVRAMDYFIASSNPNTPFKRQNIKAENLVRDVLGLAGLTNFSADPTNFTFAIGSPLEVNLTSSYDYSKFIADLLAWHLYGDENGVVRFIDRKPFVDGDSPIKTITASEILNYKYIRSDRNLRNRVVVYGANGIYAEASASSPHLPAGFYKTVVVAAPQVFDTQAMAQNAANRNLSILNRLTESCSISVIGDPDLLARRCITLVDPVLLETENWYIFSAEHSLGMSGYITNLELRR